MNTTTSAFLAAGLAYLMGSIPFGYLLAKIFKDTDIRTLGSGNIGATNIARTFGVKWGVLVFFLDALKGGLAVWFLPGWFFGQDHAALLHVKVLCGIVTVLGHIFPVWLQFRGGKGVATAAGVVLVLSPIPSLVAVVIYALMLWWKRIGSLASLSAALVFGVAHFVLGMSRGNLWESAELSRTLFALIMPVGILASHKKNLIRLFRGEEPKFGQKKPTASDQKAQREPTEPGSPKPKEEQEPA